MNDGNDGALVNQKISPLLVDHKFSRPNLCLALTTTMKFSIALLSITTGTVGAFAPSVFRSTTSVPLASTTEAVVDDVASAEPVVVSPAEPLGPTINGWTPDATKPCYGLPGAIEPLGFFDPLELSKDKDLNEIKRLREAEVLHGRVASKCIDDMK